MKRLCIIVPILNEFVFLKQFLKLLNEFRDLADVILVDGGSVDGSLELASSFPFTVLNSEKGRAIQMNKGAFANNAQYLLFIHADTFIDLDFKKVIFELLENECKLASFKLVFQPTNTFLTINAFFSRINHPFFYFGDQGLWISRELFNELGGFNEKYLLLEGQELFSRAFKKTRSYKINHTIKTSSRSYQKYGSIRLQFLYYRIWVLYKLGYSQKELLLILERFKTKYKSLLSKE